MLSTPFVLDFFVTALLFIICLFITVGFQVVSLSLKEFFQKPAPPTPVKAQVAPTTDTPKPRRKRKRKPVRSIEIDPDEIDRIYVKKFF